MFQGGSKDVERCVRAQSFKANFEVTHFSNPAGVSCSRLLGPGPSFGPQAHYSNIQRSHTVQSRTFQVNLLFSSFCFSVGIMVGGRHPQIRH